MRPLGWTTAMVLLTLACRRPGQPAASVLPGGPVRANVELVGDVLRVVMDVPRGIDDLELPTPSSRFFGSFDGEGCRVRRAGDHVSLSMEGSSCRVQYTFQLGIAAGALDNPDWATRVGATLEAPPSTWLARPRTGRVLFRAQGGGGITFVSGARKTGDDYNLDVSELVMAPYSAFGRFRVHKVPAPGAELMLAVGEGPLGVTDSELAAWVRVQAAAIGGFYGRFPVDHALILVAPMPRGEIGLGKSLAGGGASIMVALGPHAKEHALREDWVLSHEMVHFAFPSLASEHLWLEEGLATYVEPIARAQGGLLSSENLWRDFIQGMPNGLPEADDRGLDHTPTWGRTYWGGALFCLEADLEIRRETKNAKGLQDALIAILDKAGSNAVSQPVEAALGAGDEGIGLSVLVPLYRKRALRPEAVDLRGLWKGLGVGLEAGRVRFDDGAPWATFRKSIAAPKGSGRLGRWSASSSFPPLAQTNLDLLQKSQISWPPPDATSKTAEWRFLGPSSE